MSNYSEGICASILFNGWSRLNLDLERNKYFQELSRDTEMMRYAVVFKFYT